MVQPHWKTIRWFVIELNILLTIQSAVIFLGIYPKDLKTYVYEKTCTCMFIAALFIIAKTWKQPRCPSEGEWTNKLWYIQIMEYYLMIRRNELVSHEKTQRKIKCMLSERNQSEKAIYCLIPAI